MKKKYFIFILLFVLAVGYAAVNVTMYFEGSTTLGFNFEDADIYLGNLYSNNINKYNSISEDKTSFSLVLQNGETNVDFYVVNNTKEYTENITITCNNIDTVTQEDNYEHMVYAQTTLKGSIKFTNTGAPKDLVCVVNNTEI